MWNSIYFVRPNRNVELKNRILTRELKIKTNFHRAIHFTKWTKKQRVNWSHCQRTHYYPAQPFKIHSFESKAIYSFIYLFCTKNDQWSVKPSWIKCTMPTWSRKNQVMITKSNFSASASLVVFLIFLHFPVVLDPKRHAYNEQFWLRWHLLRKQSWWFPSWFPHSPVSVLRFSFVFHDKGKEQSRKIC